MSDYIPTPALDALKASEAHNNTYRPVTQRWLAEHDIEVAKVERQNIIEELEGLEGVLYLLADANQRVGEKPDLAAAYATRDCINHIKYREGEYL
jgi:hypothetical protein